VVLVGGGDPTLAAPHPDGTPAAGYPPPAQLADLAAQVRSSVGGRPVTRVLVDESLYSGERIGPGWRPTYVSQGAVAPVVPLMLDGGRVRPDRLARSAEPGLAAGAALGALLQPGAPVEVARGSAAADAAELGAVQSPTVAQLVERMLLRSDNDLAEALARQVALATGRPASFAGAAEAVREVLGPSLQAAGVPGRRRAGRRQRPVPAEPAAARRGQPAARPGRRRRRLGRRRAAQPVLSGLPVGGFSGTLADRYREAAAALPAAGRAAGQDRDPGRGERAGRAAAHRRRPAARLRPDGRRGAARREPAGRGGPGRAGRCARGCGCR
jgi:D-alanyl-D-alanine carboxypeptidase/D-alanyl-D-alanine-endopeptidase (penicillin-binding protein 4)